MCGISGIVFLNRKNFSIKNAVKVPIKERERFQQENINYEDNI
jgi:hypothetical protein